MGIQELIVFAGLGIASGTRGAESPCDFSLEGRCRSSPAPGVVQICASGKWQDQRSGAWICMGGHLRPYQNTISAPSNTTSIAGFGTSNRTLPTYSSHHEYHHYQSFYGSGSANEGWPPAARWKTFDQIFTANLNNIKQSCQQWNVSRNSDQEIADLRSAIELSALSSRLDARFILAVVMQESQGCVRVITTYGSHANPGLMQSFDGRGSCNLNSATSHNLAVMNPCPFSVIHEMIKEGTEGTARGGLGLVQYMALQGVFNETAKWYRTARMYNGGNISASGRLEDGCCTRSYASDIANRLLGWASGPSGFV